MQKMLLREIVCVLLVWRIYGWEFTITVIAIAISLSIVGAYIGRNPLFMLFVGMLVMGFAKDVLMFFLPHSFVHQIFAGEMNYPGFYMSVVRSITLGIEHARMTSVSLTDLLRNSIGYTVASPVCMSSTFMLLPDWMKWREGKTKFTVTDHLHLEEEQPPPRTGETVRRTVSIRRVFLNLLRLGFWILVLKYGLGSIDLIGQLCGPVRRISRGFNVRPLDGFTAYFIAFVNVGKFSLFYIVFYGCGRIIGDLQQFVLSPLFARDTSRLVVEQRDNKLLKSTHDCSLWKKLICSEVTINGLMPDGPRCLLGTLLSSEVWRFFDQGLYHIMKHYIYILWAKFVRSIFPANSVVFKELGAISGAVVTYCVVLTYHSWSKGNLVWICSSFLLWTMERFGVHYYKSMKAEEKLTSLLSAEWEIRIRCFGYATLQTFNILCFMFFHTNYNAGYWLSKAVLTNWLIFLECWAFIYTAVRMNVQTRTWSSQSTKEDNKVK